MFDVSAVGCLGVFMGQIISLWAFACNLYQQSQVEKACLSLQDAYSADVPVLLFCFWAGQHSVVLSPSQWVQVHSLTESWTVQCIRPLRHIRQVMKQSIPDTVSTDVPNAPHSSAWQHVRDEVKAAELLAEQQLLEALERMIRNDVEVYAHNHQETTDTDAINAMCMHQSVCAVKNIATYCGLYLSHAPVDSVGLHLLTDILHAVHPEITYDVALETVKINTAIAL